MRTLAILLTLVFPAVLVHAQDIYEIKFTANTAQHRGALVMWWNEGFGKMRVRYYGNGATKMVEQTMRVEKTSVGTRIAGYNAVYPGTSQRHSTYITDNFYVSQDENGRLSVVNVDDQNEVAVC